jgi:hypothetical protein
LPRFENLKQGRKNTEKAGEKEHRKDEGEDTRHKSYPCAGQVVPGGARSLATCSPTQVKMNHDGFTAIIIDNKINLLEDQKTEKKRKTSKMMKGLK